MPRMLVLVSWLLAVPLLALLSPGHAVAGPPEGASGRMVLAPDHVGRKLREYRKEADPGKRLWLLMELAWKDDPRVGVALGEALSDREEAVRDAAAHGILTFADDLPASIRYDLIGDWARKWWKKNEADLRRRAKQLPQ